MSSVDQQFAAVFGALVPFLLAVSVCEHRQAPGAAALMEARWQSLFDVIKGADHDVNARDAGAREVLSIQRRIRAVVVAKVPSAALGYLRHRGGSRTTGSTVSASVGGSSLPTSKRRHARLCRFGTVFASFRATGRRRLGTLCGKRTTARGISKTSPKDRLAVMSVTD